MLKLRLILFAEKNNYVIDIKKEKKRFINIQIINAEDRMKFQLFKCINKVIISQ